MIQEEFKALVDNLVKEKNVSIKQACKEFGKSPSIYYYKPKLKRKKETQMQTIVVPRRATPIEKRKVFALALVGDRRDVQVMINKTMANFGGGGGG